MHSMNNIKCENTMNTFLALDKGEHIPLKVSLHLIFCAKCRTQVRLLTRAEHLAAYPLSRSASESDYSVAAVLKKIDEMKNTSIPNPITLRQWVVSGVLMILLMLSFGFSASDNSEELKIAFYLIFALIITVYCALFIGCNIDFFIKKINTSDFTLQNYRLL